MIKLYNDNLKKDWCEYILSNIDSSLWHHYYWFEIFEKLFSFKNKSLIHYNENTVDGLLPLFHVNNIIYQNYAISTPFANYSGVLADNKKVKNNLINKSLEQIKDVNFRYLEIRSTKSLDNFESLKTFATMLLDLRPSIDDIWKNSLKGKTRNQVRKAYDNNLKLNIDNNEKCLKDFYNVYVKNITRLGTPVFPIKYFQLMSQLFKENLKFINVTYAGKTIGSLIMINYKNICYIPYASTLVTMNYLCPNNILYWEAIKYAKNCNMSNFDFGRSTIGTGTYKFKLQWGATVQQLHYNYKLLNQSYLPQTGANNNKYKYLMKLWSKLPVVISKKISNLVIDKLPEL